MNIAIIGHRDYAASGACLGIALRSAGHTVSMFGDRRHKFEYPVEWDPILASGSQSVRENICREAVDEADVVFLMHGRPPESITDEMLRGKRLVPVYGGSNYRDDPRAMVDRWGPSSIATLFFTADLMGYGAPNEHLVVPPVTPSLYVRPNEYVAPYRRWRGRPVVGHFPSSVETKGTREILEVLYAFEKDGAIILREPTWDAGVSWGVRHVSWEAQIERMADCDVIVDQIKPTLNGRPFGEWGSCAVEAAALGCIVIANSRNRYAYFDAYGVVPEIQFANTPGELEWVLDMLCEMDETAIGALGDRTRAWVLRHHSIEATGQRLASILNRSLETSQCDTCPSSSSSS